MNNIDIFFNDIYFKHMLYEQILCIWKTDWPKPMLNNVLKVQTGETRWQQLLHWKMEMFNLPATDWNINTY